MSPERWQQIDKLFHAALACEPEQRATFLIDACAGDESLRTSVESLLSSHEDIDKFTGEPSRLTDSADFSPEINDKSQPYDFQTLIAKPANAYQAYQLARYHFHKASFPDLAKSRFWLEEALRLDINFGSAHAALAEQCVMEAITGLAAPLDIFPMAKNALRQAFGLNLDAAEFHAVAGFVALVCDWSFAEAEWHLRKSLELNPHHTYANVYLGQVCMFQGRWGEAENCLLRAQEIEPMGLHNRIILVISYFLARDYQRVIEECDKLLAIYPRFAVATGYRCLALEQTGRHAEAIVEYENVLSEPDGEVVRRWVGYAYARAGDRENALKTIAKLDAERREHYLSPTHQALVYGALGETDRAFSYLESALVERDPWLLWIATDPRCDTLRSHSRFRELVRGVGVNLKTPSEGTSSPLDQPKTVNNKIVADRWQTIDRLFHDVLACDPAGRAAFLTAACAGDELLRVEVESLISFHDGEGSFIETPPGDIAAALLGSHQRPFGPGRQIDNYLIKRELGIGGMGEVYLADDTKLNRKVALKLLPLQFTIDVDRVRRFEQEARAASALNHPNIVTIHEIRQSNSVHFIATEFVDGVTLRQHLTDEEMTLGEVLDVGAQVASALAAAHDAGIVHRDIKPENIMLRRDGFVKLLDFGLAKLTSDDAMEIQNPLSSKVTLKTDPGMVMGTVQYMSPEQARAETVDASTDIWSLGVMLYEMLTGHVPFTGETRSHAIVSILETEPSPLSAYVETPPQLDRIVFTALSKNKADRYQSASQIAVALKELRQELEVEARLKRVTHPDVTREVATSVIATAEPKKARRPIGWRSFREISDRRTLVIGMLLFVVLAMGLTYVLINRTNAKFNSETTRKSIAVLPPKPVNNSSRNELYEVGIADSLIHRLSSFGLVVRPLNAIRKYADGDQDPLAAGKEQQVDYVLISNYELSDGHIRVTSQLVNVVTGQIENIHKSEQDTANAFAMQDAIAVEVGNLLRARFATTDAIPVVKRGTTNEEAYRLYQQGMYLYGKRTERASKQAIELLDQAVQLDPNYALAWAAKAHAHRYAANLGRDTDIHAEYRKSIEAINKALSLDPNLSEAYSALCENKYYYEFDFAGAEAQCKRAIVLDPNSSLAHEIYGRFLYHRGRFAEGISELKTAVDLEPTSLFNQRNLGLAFYYAGLYREAEAQFKRVIAMDETFVSAYSWLRNVFELQGNYPEAFDWFMKHQAALNADHETLQLYRNLYQHHGYQAVLREYVNRFDKSINQYYVAAVIHAQIGNKDKAFEYLEIAYNRREWGLNSLLIEHRLDSLRDDPRFKDLVRRVESK